VHNLRAYAWRRQKVEPFDWAVRFEQRVRELLVAGEDEPLINYEGLGRDAMLSVPTPDHYLPLLYILALRREGEPVSFPVRGGGWGPRSRCSPESDSLRECNGKRGA
jgi:4,5-DOPA dioxygenase extradiol